MMLPLNVGMESSYFPSVGEDVSSPTDRVLELMVIPEIGVSLSRMVPLSVMYAGNSVVVLEMMVFPMSSPSVGVAEQETSSPGRIPSIEFCGLRNELE